MIQSDDDGFAFRGARGEKLGPTTVAYALRAADINASGHGFRSSFEDWARHEGVDELLSEFALAHVEGSKTVAAYARDDLLELHRTRCFSRLRTADTVWCEAKWAWPLGRDGGQHG